MPTVDFTKAELLDELDIRVRGIVREEFDNFEPKVKRIVKLETMESEARIKTEIKHYVDVEHQDLKERLGRFGKAAASLLGDK